MRLSTFYTVLLIVFALAVVNGCSNVPETSAGNISQLSDYGDNSLTFRKDGAKWRVDFEEGEIAAIYKNGERLPSEDHHIYKDMIYDKVNRLRNNLRDPKSEMLAFNFDMGDLKSNLQEMKKNLRDNLPGKIEIEIDREEFDKGMDALRESMKELKSQKFEFHFDKDSFKDDMKKLKEDLKKIDFDKIKIEVRKNLDDLDKDIERIKIEMKDLDIDLKGLDSDMKALSLEMEKLGGFIKEIKSELVKDGYINSEDEKINLMMQDELIIINGKELSPEHQKKYSDIYEKHFDKKINGDFKIKIRK
jgi:chromosome segregation ATPase